MMNMQLRRGLIAVGVTALFAAPIVAVTLTDEPLHAHSYMCTEKALDTGKARSCVYTFDQSDVRYVMWIDDKGYVAELTRTQHGG